MRILIRLGILALILAGGWLFRDRLSSGAADLAVGDCFDVPATKTSVKDVQHHPCGESHTGEVFAIVTHPAAKGAAPLATDALYAYLANTCGPLLTSYVGPVAAGSRLLDAGAFYPPDAGWNNGDRKITCYVYRVDGTATTSSAKKTP